ncbi:MAG: Zn-dependent alcohol dehydrogenase [Deltaproteobacteria bacterium]|nr:MAG: Zn-dependent alcohol dehydrogenase [Deltaproteobacteria bacterium]
MRAAILEEQRKPLDVVDDLTVSEPGPGQVRVAVRHCGICHSDLGIVDAENPAMQLPIVLGHEAAGEVERVGPGVTALAPGDRVVLTPAPPCGACYWCVRGEHALCVNSDNILTSTFADGSTGLARRGQVVYRGLGVGGFAEQVITQSTGAVVIPRDVPTEIACVIGCAVQTGVGAVLNTARVEEGATVLVMGAGGIGLSIVQGARLAGASAVIVSDPVAARREVAGRLGATHLVDPNADDVVARCRAITNGIGVDYAFDAAGAAALVDAGIQATRKGGMTVMVGAVPITQPITIPIAALFGVQEKKLVGCILGSCNSQRDVPRMVSLWQAGKLDLEALITARYPLSRINEALDELRAKRGVRHVVEF